jgi:hypothetical protein
MAAASFARSHPLSAEPSHFDATASSGAPIWYLSSNTTPSTNLPSYTNTWSQYANRQTLAGAFKPATQANNNVGPVTITFQHASAVAILAPAPEGDSIRASGCSALR